METCTIPAHLVEALKEMGRSEGVTPYMILLAVFQVLLYRYSGQDEIIVGGATNTRTRPEFEPLMGYFLNAVVFRSQIRADLSFRRIPGTRSKAQCSAPWRTVRFLSTLWCANWRPSATPAVTRCSKFYSRCGRPSPIFRTAGTSPTWRSTAALPSFDLFVEFSEHPEGLAGRFVYSTDLFDRATIQRLLATFSSAAARVGCGPGPGCLAGSFAHRTGTADAAGGLEQYR